MPQITDFTGTPPTLQDSNPSAALGALPSDPPPAPVPTSSTPVPGVQVPFISTEISPPTVEEGGEEEDMGLDDDASMISRVHPLGSDVAPNSNQNSLELSSALPLSLSPPLEDDSSGLVLSLWQNTVPAIKMKFEGDMLPPSPRKRTCRVRDDSGHQQEEDPVFHLPLVSTLQDLIGFLQEDLSNPPKPGATNSDPCAESLNREDKAALPPLGKGSFMFSARPDSNLSNLLPPGMTSFPAKSFSL